MSVRCHLQLLAILSLVLSVAGCGRVRFNFSRRKPRGILSALLGFRSSPVNSPVSSPPASSSKFMNGFSHRRSASTGLLLSKWSTADWINKSAEMCAMGNEFTNAWNEVSRTDQIMCYVGAMLRNNLFTGDIYDGSYHYYQWGGGQVAAPAFITRILATQNANGDVIAYQIVACEGASLQPNDLVDYSVDPDKGQISATSYGTHAINGVTAIQLSNVTGTFNALGDWTQKTVTTNASFSNPSSPTFNEALSMQLVQSTAYAVLSGYFTGIFGGVNSSGQLYSKFQLLNDESLPTLAIGDGSAMVSLNGGATQLQSWSGDTQLNLSDATTGDYYSGVSNAVLPVIGTPDYTAPASTIWDCQADAGSYLKTVTVSDLSTGTIAADLAACDLQYQAGSDS